MTRSLPKHLCMGVINITPDSFSDGGSLPDLPSLISKIEFLKKSGAHIIDIGAQSTAPTSSPICQNAEMDRFERFLVPLLKDWDSEVTLSIDTYRPEVFKWLYDQNPRLNWIFNDISGHLDETILESCPNAQVVLGHNLCPNREEAPHHLKYTLSIEENPLDHMEEFFKSKNLSSRVILDPLFGFSKNFEQNMLLLKNLPELIKRFSPEQKFLIGISKKSFLRKSLPPSSDLMNDSEYLHLLFLSVYLKNLKYYNLILRVHDPKVYQFARLGAGIIENIASKSYIPSTRDNL